MQPLKPLKPCRLLAMMQSLKVGAVIAVVLAVICSSAVLQPLEILALAFGAVFAATAAFAVYLLQTLSEDLKYGNEALQSVLEKVTYVEHRLDTLGGRLGDTTRHLQQDFGAFREEASSMRWLQRRIRSHFEAWSAAAMKTGSCSVVAWNLTCLETKLRSCRDIVMERMELLEDCSPEALEHKLGLDRFLQNLNIQGLKFWTPMSIEDMKVMEPKSALEDVLQDQCLERAQEMQELQISCQSNGAVQNVQLQ